MSKISNLTSLCSRNLIVKIAGNFRNMTKLEYCFK